MAAPRRKPILTSNSSGAAARRNSKYKFQVIDLTGDFKMTLRSKNRIPIPIPKGKTHKGHRGPACKYMRTMELFGQTKEARVAVFKTKPMDHSHSLEEFKVRKVGDFFASATGLQKSGCFQKSHVRKFTPHDIIEVDPDFDNIDMDLNLNNNEMELKIKENPLGQAMPDVKAEIKDPFLEIEIADLMPLPEIKTEPRDEAELEKMKRDYTDFWKSLQTFVESFIACDTTTNVPQKQGGIQDEKMLGELSIEPARGIQPDRGFWERIMDDGRSTGDTVLQDANYFSCI
jgi:hypothetical protein